MEKSDCCDLDTGGTWTDANAILYQFPMDE